MRGRGRTVADAARDTAELADYLGAGSFFIAGWSGGGPAALACAALLAQRVNACIVLAGRAPPLEAGDAWFTWATDDDRADRQALETTSSNELKDEYRVASEPFLDIDAESLLAWPANSPSDVVAMQKRPAAAGALARSMRLDILMTEAR